MDRLIDQIRAAYPIPVRAGIDRVISQQDYCVLGAIGLYAQSHLGKFANHPQWVNRFPDSLTGAWYLDLVKGPPYKNRYARMMDTATAIHRANDQGNFERAWELAGEALELV